MPDLQPNAARFMILEKTEVLDKENPVLRPVLFILCVVIGLLSGCTDPHVNTYRENHKAFLKELIYCENHYATERNSAACQAAFKVNSELFPD